MTIKNCSWQRPPPYCLYLWCILWTTQNCDPKFSFTKIVIQNKLLWVTSNNPPFNNNLFYMIHQFTFAPTPLYSIFFIQGTFFIPSSIFSSPLIVVNGAPSSELSQILVFSSKLASWSSSIGATFIQGKIITFSFDHTF